MNVNRLRYIDLFCGIGGFRFAMEAACTARRLAPYCVLSSDIDKDCQSVYLANFGELPLGDIKAINSASIPDHDVLLAGFPCQPFSIIGDSKGFEDARGTLFFEIARVLRDKRPKAFVLENVKQLSGHDNGRTLSRILECLDNLGYSHSHRVLNALDFGLPQKRERIFIVGSLGTRTITWPLSSMPMKPLSAILERDVPQYYYASEMIKARRRAHLLPTNEPTIWHENKSGHISAYPYSCALRAGASYNYLLVNGERRLTEREMLRLQGFPESFKITGTYAQVRKQAGNSLPVPVAQAVIERLLDSLELGTPPTYYVDTETSQLSMVMEGLQA